MAWRLNDRRAMRVTWLVAAIGIGAVASGCGGPGSAPDAPTAPDGAGVDARPDAASPFAGVVAINTNLSLGDPLADYSIEYPATYAIGARGAQTAADWRALEPSPPGGPCAPAYDLTMLTNPYFGLDALTADGFTDILLNVAIVSIRDRRMPCDLIALPFDDPQVIARYRALIDTIAPHLGTNVKYVALGNEVDSYFAQPAHATEWSAYKTLVDDARAYLKTLRPDLVVGVTATFAGATSTHVLEIADLDAGMDAIFLTYYPLDFTTFRPRDPSTVATDLAAAVAVAGDRPLVFQEWGYPSSPDLGSDEQDQAAFVANTFTSWVDYGADRIPFVSFFKRRDWNQAHCAAQCPVSPPPPQCIAFEAYLCSLGLVANDGTPKAAYQVLADQLAALHGP